jgi:pilus assembly protein HofN
MTPVNLLPWRQVRLRRRLRVGYLVFFLLTVATLVVMSSRLLLWRTQSATLDIHLSAEAQVNRALAQREAQLKQRQQAQVQQQQTETARRLTQDWQTRLARLAADLPAQAWLTGLSYQNDVLTLSGTLNRFSALQEVDAMMAHVDGFQPAVAGKMERDKEGRWLFNYRMNRSVPNAAP